jgi:hypothetical protein
MNNRCVLKDCQPILEENKRYFALSLLYKKNSLPKEALAIWRELICAKIIDIDFPGSLFVIDYLIKLNDAHLIWQHADHILRRDPNNGIKVFTDRNDNLFDFNQVLNYVSIFGTKTRKTYLEVYIEDKSKSNIVHMELSILYMEQIILLADKDILDETALTHSKSLEYFSFYQFLTLQKDPLSQARIMFFNFIVDKCEADMELLVNRLLEYLEYGNLYFEQLAIAIKVINYLT